MSMLCNSSLGNINLLHVASMHAGNFLKENMENSDSMHRKLHAIHAARQFLHTGSPKLFGTWYSSSKRSHNEYHQETNFQLTFWGGLCFSGYFIYRRVDCHFLRFDTSIQFSRQHFIALTKIRSKIL